MRRILACWGVVAGLLISPLAGGMAQLTSLATPEQTLNHRQWPQVQETVLGAALLQRYVYSYSHAGNLTFLDDQADGSDDVTLAYDHLHRLTSASGLWGSYGYTYDPLHNIRSRTGPSALTYSYDGSNRLTGISGAQSRSYAYNAQGEITGDGVKSFSLNANGQITGITGIASYVYDGNGRRIRSTPQGGTPEYALYGLGGDLLYTERGTEKTDFLKLGGQTLVELKKVGSTTTATYLHPDLLGSPRKATSATAVILWQEHYDPYGAKLSGVNEKIGYTGHAHDPESGYTYMQARFYDPLVGRFLSTDPIHFQDSNPFTFNRYAYANNNPYRYHDPDGRAAIAACAVPGPMQVCAAIGTAIVKAAAWLGARILIVWGGNKLLSEATDTASDPGNSDAESADGENSAAGGAALPPPDGDNNDKGDKQKKGKPERNVDQNKRVDDAAREAGLDKQQRRELGRYIEQGSRKYGENYSYGDILDAAERIKGGERLINIK